MTVAVGEMSVDFIRDAGSTGRAQVLGSTVPGPQVPEGDGSGEGGSHDEPMFWWKYPFVYLYVISPAGSHDHKVWLICP